MSDQQLRAGLAAAVSDEIHAVETGFAGVTALCGAGTITRPLRTPFDPAGRGVCADCARLVASPELGTRDSALLL